MRVLAGGIAHDFNNLLGGIFGYLDLARLERTEQSRQECIDHALLVMERARDLTRQLLTFAKGTPNRRFAPGFTGSIAKPFTAGELSLLLNQHLPS